MSLLLLLVASCGWFRPDPCADYADSPESLAWCRVEKASEADTIEAARCDGLGEREEACRVRWVQTHTDREQAELLAACTTDECRFVAVDWKPLPIGLQFEQCARLNMLANPCRVHATARYFGGRPSSAQQRQDLAPLVEHAFVVGNQAGLARYCGFEVDCSVFGPYAEACDQVGRFGRMGGDCSAFRPNFPQL